MIFLSIFIKNKRNRSILYKILYEIILNNINRELLLSLQAYNSAITQTEQSYTQLNHKNEEIF